MGFLCEHGYGVPKDEAAAMSWYRKAAERGDTEAQKNANRPNLSENVNALA